MASQKAPSIPDHVGHLLAARLRSASEERNVDKLMSYYAKDATVLDVVNGQFFSGWDAIRDFYTEVYQKMPVFKIQPQKITVASNCLILELTCEGTMAVATTKSSEDEQLSSATPTTIRMVGVTLLWWRWEGGSGEEDSNGESSHSSLLGWKIIEERAYVMRS